MRPLSIRPPNQCASRSWPSPAVANSGSSEHAQRWSYPAAQFPRRARGQHGIANPHSPRPERLGEPRPAAVKQACPLITRIDIVGRGLGDIDTGCRRAAASGAERWVGIDAPWRSRPALASRAFSPSTLRGWECETAWEPLLVIASRPPAGYCSKNNRLGELHERDVEEVDPEAGLIGFVDMARAQLQEGVSTTSPGQALSTRAPLTTVNVPGLSPPAPAAAPPACDGGCAAVSRPLPRTDMRPPDLRVVAVEIAFRSD